MNYVVLLSVVLLCTIPLCGCMSENAGVASPDMVSKDGWYAGEMAPELANEMMSAPPADTTITQTLKTDKKLIRSGSLTLEVTNVSDSMDRITEIALDFKGFIDKSTKESDANDQVTGLMIVRIPGEDFDSFLETISSQGTIKRQEIQTTDVTEDYIDKEAQIRALTIQRDQYYRIIEKAETVEDILNVQREIDRVQLELDRITGKMKYLENQIAFGTLTISIHPRPVLTSEGVDAFTRVLQEAASGFTGMISFLVVFFVTIIPVLIIIYIIYRLFVRAGVLRRFKK